ncbi:MAG: IPT/TIG domain-containing protein [Acidobacteriota bacterium]|nr:IPT/TIG domain-containing protein [Acidobacteriota bacterium]
MRRIGGFVIALTLCAFGAFADEASEHLEHLRMMMHEMSSHGAIVPQPEAINPLAAKAFSITARSFSFTPPSFSVNQGDVVTLTISVPSNDASSIGHGMLMDTYIEGGVDVGKGQTKTVTFTATTPGTFAWVCTQPSCGTGHSSMFGQMIVNAVSTLSITSVTPNTGSTSGGTDFTISGSNLGSIGTTTVTFGGAAATIRAVNSSAIIGTTPAHAPGAVDVVVTTGGQTATASGAFTYVAPSVTSISPNTGSTAGGTVVNINGTGFQTGATVTIGGIAATDVSVVSSTTITAKTPIGPATQQAGQPRDVVVTNPDGTTATLTRGFTYFVPTLTVASLSPTVGGTSGGTVVTISGTGFTTGVNSSVTFGGAAAANVTVVDAVTLQATTPPHAAGTVDVVVTFGTSVTRTNAFTYVTTPPRHRSAKH